MTFETATIQKAAALLRFADIKLGAMLGAELMGN